MINETFPSLTKLYQDVVMRLAFDEPGVADLHAAPSIYSYDNKLVAEHGTFEEFDLGGVGLTKSRWTRFLNAYVDMPLLREWLPYAAKVDRPRVAGIMMKHVGAHSWGNCLVSIGFRRAVHPTLVVYSRASSLCPTGAIDFAFVSVVCRNLAQLMEIEQDDITVVWNISSAYVSGILWLPYLASSGREKEYLASDSRLVRTTGRVFKRWISQSDTCHLWHQCLRVHYPKRAEHCPFDDEECIERLPKFGPVARTINRYFQIKQGVMAKCLVKDLELPE